MTQTNQTHEYCVCKKYEDYYDEYYEDYYDEYYEDYYDVYDGYADGYADGYNNNNFNEMKYNIVQQMFPTANFIISIPLQDIEKTISNLDKIIVKQTFDCYCYDGYEPELPAKWFPIHCSFDKGEKMTNKFVINELIKQSLVLDCNHCYLKGFILSSNNTTCQYEMLLGS
jgi:hypothetical protein